MKRSAPKTCKACTGAERARAFCVYALLFLVVKVPVPAPGPPAKDVTKVPGMHRDTEGLQLQFSQKVVHTVACFGAALAPLENSRERL